VLVFGFKEWFSAIDSDWKRTNSGPVKNEEGVIDDFN
jgi:hypothetical protein